jgi:hypothetical protein
VNLNFNWRTPQVPPHPAQGRAPVEIEVHVAGPGFRPPIHKRYEHLFDGQQPVVQMQGLDSTVRLHAR